MAHLRSERTVASFLLVFVLALIAACSTDERARQAKTSGDPTKRPSRLEYDVFIEAGQEPEVRIRAALSAEVLADDQTIRFAFARGKTFVKLDEPLIEGPITARTGQQNRAVNRLSAFTFEVDTQGRQSVVLEYWIPIRHRTLPRVVEANDQYEFPYLAFDHGMLTSWTLFAKPQDFEPQTLDVRFHPPEGWAVIAPWPSSGPGRFAPSSLEELIGDVIALGAWSCHRLDVGDFEGTIAFAPGQAELERSAAEPIREIVTSELELFGRPAEGQYLFLFGRPDASGAGGSPKNRSMTLTIDPQLAGRGFGFLGHLIAHEFHHTWNASLYHCRDELRWFNEGFTDYYAYLVIARLGQTSWEAFAGTLADQMSVCSENPLFGKISLLEAGGEVFFRDRDAYRLIYSGGLLVAAWLDQSIRSRGEGYSLDDFMRAFNNDPRWGRGVPSPTVADFFDELGSFVSAETVLEARMLVSEPFCIDPIELFDRVGVEVDIESGIPELSLRANLDGTRVVDIDPDGLAARIGILAGDRFVEVNDKPVSSQRDVRLAWRRPVAGAIRLKIERDSHDLWIDEPIPKVIRYSLDAAPWQEHDH